MKTLIFAMFGIAVAAVPSIASAQELEYFDDQQAFRNAAMGLGYSLHGVETFEESSLGANRIDFIDDPLIWGTSNLGTTTGQGFTNGLTGLANLRIQTNAGGWDSETEQPQGNDGLLMISNGWDGVTSDIAVSNSFVNGTDFIYEGGTRAIGGRLFIYSNNPNITALRIDLYGMTPGFQGFIDSIMVDGDRAATQFWGVTSDVLIRRVNIVTLFGTEGLDDIEVWGEPVPEPATMIILAAGSIAVMRRRRQK